MAWKSPKRMNGGVLRNVENKITPAVERKDLTLARRGVDIIRASDLKPKKLLRLWNGRFYRGKVGLIAGDPGLGKSQIGTYMAATVSAGGEWPCGEGSACRGDVILITAEDGAADTIRPRLEAAGADLNRVHVIERVKDQLGPRQFNLLTDLGELERVLRLTQKPRLVIIDPINACLSSTDGRPFNPNSVQHARALFGRLEALAARCGVAVVGVTHFTKAKGGSALSRVTGSFAFVAAVGAVFTVTRKQDDPDLRIFASAKNNLGRDVDALAFRIEQRITSDNIQAPYAIFV